MKASDLMVKCLENEGVETIFGVPGEENLDFLESLRTSKIDLILTRHEQGAAFMAATYGRLTGKPGVCLSTLGPGATNFVTGAAYAQLGGMPIIMISGQKPIKKSKQGRFQVLDTVEMMKPLTKFSKQIVNGNNIPSLVRDSFRLAEEERPGAIYLELPEDIASEPTEAKPINPSCKRRPNADDKSIQLAAELISKARRPLLLIGAAANRKSVHLALTDFIRKKEIFFFNTQMGKGVIDERSPYYLGTAALSSDDYLHCAIDRADLIINVGHDVIEKPPFFMREGETKVIHLNHFSAQIDPVYFPSLEVIGDIANSIRKISDLIQPEGWDQQYYIRVKQGLEQHVSERSDDSRFPIIPQSFLASVRANMPEDGIVSLDNGIYKIWFTRNYKAFRPNTLLLDNALATMGAGLPCAMAAKFIMPEKKVLAVCGDGGFMMNSQEMETAVRLNLDLTVVILRDNAYGMIKWKQSGMGFPSFGLDYGNPDFVRYAESYGAYGHRVESYDHLNSILKECLTSKGVHLIEVPVDYSENERVLIEELSKKTCLV